MSVFKDRAEWLDHFEFKLGSRRGRLAAVMDILSDLGVLLGTHTAYCQKGKSSAQPANDIGEAMKHVEHAKELVGTLLHAPDETNHPQSGE